MLRQTKRRKFANGVVYALETDDGYPLEVTDTHLPFYTKDALGRKQNALKDGNLGSRAERWMIGVSVMSGCPVGCKFCATGSLPKWRRLTAEEIIEQVRFVLHKNPACMPMEAREFKINYTRMGEPFLNQAAVRLAVADLSVELPLAHHYISTIGIRDSDFSWIKGRITLQLSVHSLNATRRAELIPYPRLLSLKELGEIRTGSDQKTTVNLTLVDWADFNVDVLKAWFPPDHFFIKLSPINENVVSRQHGLGTGVVEGKNLA